MPDYEKLLRLGAGNFGEVWLMFDRALGVNRAVKIVRPSKIHTPTEVYKEPRTLMELRHENIVRVEDAGTNPDGTLYIAMEFLHLGSLETRYKGRQVQIKRARRFLCDVCWDLQFAHQRGFIHRDIKPANILVGDHGEGKLSDFGLATRAPRGEVASPYGYLTHLAPEVFRASVTSIETDIYALGVTAYRLINGDAFLPTIDTEAELLTLIERGDYPDRTRYRPYVPKSLRQVINKAMNVDPARRYESAADFRLALERINMFCDWGWRLARNAVIYKAKILGNRITTRVDTRPKGRFDITTMKAAHGGAPRRISKDCATDLSMKEMKTRLHKILARYVSEGK